MALTAAQPVFLALLLDVLAGFADDVEVGEVDVVLLTTAASVQAAKTPTTATIAETARMMTTPGILGSARIHKENS